LSIRIYLQRSTVEKEGEEKMEGRVVTFVVDGLDLGRVDFIAWFVDPVIPKDWVSKVVEY